MPAASTEAVLERLPGIASHPHARAVLAPALPPAGRASHAYLFCGPSGTGKREVARAFAAALLSDGAPDPDGASARVLRGAHPDLAWVTPSGAAEMLVSDIDEAVVAAAARTPFEARRRVFVIERADTLNDQAANRMLKTLEEPPAYVHLILITDRPADLLPTIVSRCQPVRFDPLSSEELAARLVAEGVAEPRASSCARLALGDGARAGVLAGERGVALRAAAEAFARAALGGSGAQRRPWAALLELARGEGERAADAVAREVEAEREFLGASERRRHEREGAERARRAARRAATGALDHGLQLVGLWFRDLACVADGAPDLVYASDRLAELEADAAGRGAPRLREALELVEDTRQRLVVNVSEELACEALAYRLERELAAAA